MCLSRMKGNIQGFDGKTLKERGNMEETGVCGMMILNWILKNSVGRTWTRLIWLKQQEAEYQTMVEFPDYPGNYRFLEKKYVLWS